MQVKIKKFDLSTIKPNRIILINGRRSSGKSVLAGDLLYHMRDRFDFAMAMCPTLESSEKMKLWLPSCCVFDRYVHGKVEALVRLASEITANKKPRRMLLLLDDVMYDKSICRSAAFRYIFYNGRHAHLTVILLQQYLMDMPPDLRTQVDYIFTMKENTVQNRTKLYKMFFGVFATQEDFNAVLERCTQNFETLVLDNTLQVGQPSECVFWYKAKLDNGPFRLCRDVFFQMEEQHRRAVPLADGLASLDADENKGKRFGPAAKQRLQVTKEDGSDEEER